MWHTWVTMVGLVLFLAVKVLACPRMYMPCLARDSMTFTLLDVARKPMLPALHAIHRLCILIQHDDVKDKYTSCMSAICNKACM